MNTNNNHDNNDIHTFAKGKWVSVMTYSFESIELGEPNITNFEIPFPWDHDTCIRHIGGWPYIHAFHHFLRI